MANPAAVWLRSALPLSLRSSYQHLSIEHLFGPATFRSRAILRLQLARRQVVRAGNIAVIMVRALDLPAGLRWRSSLSFFVSVSDKKGNSSYVTDVAAHLGGDPVSWNITFVPLRAGDFVALVAEERFSVAVSRLSFTVTAAGVHPSASLVSWMFYSSYVAGSKAFMSIVPKDAFGNNIAHSTDMPGNGYFRVSGSHVNGSAVEFLDFQYNGWTDDGYLSFEFRPTLARDFLPVVLNVVVANILDGVPSTS